MHIKLPADYVDARTAAPLPDAVLTIVGADFSLGASRVVLQVAVFATEKAAADPSLSAMSTDTLILTPEEVAMQEPAILMACYLILTSRPEFAATKLDAGVPSAEAFGPAGPRATP